MVRAQTIYPDTCSAMAMNEILTASAAVLALAIMASAALSDWRRREASDAHWAVMMAAGIALTSYLIVDSGTDPIAWLMPLSMTLMAVHLLWDRDGGILWELSFAIAIIAASAIPLVVLKDDPISSLYLPIPIIYFMMVAMYYTGVIRGGADVKSVISLSFIVPAYPSFGIVPLIEASPARMAELVVPAFSTLLLAAILTVAMTLAYAIVNIVRGDISMPEMLAGYKTSLEKARSSFVWPMADYDGDERIVSASGFDDPDALDRLESHGEVEIWVTPMIPFLVPMAAALAVVLFIGNPLFAII